ncbi:hypothetical protein HGB07_07150 [Candidatus Roizmanbacteria bacterium]|nr:hypothetical protein [Candidatus Roizmanbacteria bacterium]
MPPPKPPPPDKPPPKPDMPPHILKEIFDLKEKVGRLEGIMEVLMRREKD